MKPESPQPLGTAAQALRKARALPPPTPKQVAAVQRAVADQRDPKRWRDAWKSR